MYPYVLIAHSLVRWAVIALGILAAVSVLGAGVGARRRVAPFVIAIDLQIILGLLLWLFLSPVTAVRGGALANPETRHFTIAHPGVGLAAALLAHTGNLFLKRGFSQARLLVLLALGAVLLAAPWDRPLLRL